MIISISPSHSQLWVNSSHGLKNVYSLSGEAFKLKYMSVTLKVRNMGITQLIKNYQPRTVAFTIRQADSVAADNYIRGFIFTQVPNWTALYRKNVLLIDTPHT